MTSLLPWAVHMSGPYEAPPLTEGQVHPEGYQSLSQAQRWMYVEADGSWITSRVLP